jgi:hypothetical protein
MHQRGNAVATTSPVQQGSKLLDKRALQEAVAQLDERMGFVKDPTATAEQAQAMMRALGICPEDRFLSSEIIRMRHEYEED